MSALERHTRSQAYAMARTWLSAARGCVMLARAARKRADRTDTLLALVASLVYAAEWRAAARAALVALAVLCGCARPVTVPATTPLEPLHWRADAYPIELRVSSAMDRCQLASVVAAVTWLEARAARDLFAPLAVPPTDPAVLGLMVEGVMSIAPAAGLSTPRTVGETRRPVYEGTRVIHSATIDVTGCSPWVVAHELGHALGLDHVDNDAQRLMFPIALGGWELSDREVAQLGGVVVLQALARAKVSPTTTD